MKIALNFVLGTAAELIKVYPVIDLALERGHPVRVLSTGQSRENFLMQYRDLNLPESALGTLLESHGDLERASSALRWFARALTIGGFRAKLVTADQTYVVVHGDTLSTLVGAWLGWRAGLKVVHIEAGLRSPRLLSPFPEEITRRLVSRLVRFHVPPDARAEGNLRRAHARGEILCSQGNTLMDAVTLCAGQAALPREPFALVNIHRFENLNSDTRWPKILEVLKKASARIHLVFVCHPQTRHKLAADPAARAILTGPRVEIRDRMPFSEFIALLKQSDYLISDGGSNQEECSYLGKPCLILRDATERTEGLETCCVLTRFDEALIHRFLSDPEAFRYPARVPKERPSERLMAALEVKGP